MATLTPYALCRRCHFTPYMLICHSCDFRAATLDITLMLMLEDITLPIAALLPLISLLIRRRFQY